MVFYKHDPFLMDQAVAGRLVLNYIKAAAASMINERFQEMNRNRTHHSLQPTI
jgi:zinc protease